MKIMEDEFTHQEKIEIILDMRNGSYSGKPMTYEEVRDEFNRVMGYVKWQRVTRERIRQIINKYQDNIRLADIV